MFDYSSMGDARKSDELNASFKQHSSKRHAPAAEKKADAGVAAHPAIRKQSLNTEALRQMYNQTAISFENMEFVKQLGGVSAAANLVCVTTCVTATILRGLCNLFKCTQ